MRRAFTALEVLIVLGMVGIVAALSIPFYRQYQIRSDLELTTQQLTQALGRARLLSQSAQGGAPWGIFAPAGVLYRGLSYVKREAAFDEVYPLPSTMVISGLTDVSFSPLQGRPSATGTILITALNGDKRSISILLDQQGAAIVSGDRLMICHCMSHPPQTMVVPDNAWPAHQKHGDYLGACRIPESQCH